MLEEGTPTEEPAVVAEQVEVPPQPVEAPPKDWEAEYNVKAAEAERLAVEKAASDRTITRLAQERKQTDPVVAAQMTTVMKQNELIAKSISGTLDESRGSLEVQLAQLRAEQAQAVQGFQQAQQRESISAALYGRIEKVFAKAGVSTDSQDPEVLKVRAAFEAGNTAPDDLVDMARDVADALKNKPKDSVPQSIEQIKEQAKKEALEELKRSSGLRVDSGSPTAPISTARDVLKRYGEGDRSVSDKEVMEARRQIGLI